MSIMMSLLAVLYGKTTLTSFLRFTPLQPHGHITDVRLPCNAKAQFRRKFHAISRQDLGFINAVPQAFQG